MQQLLISLMPFSKLYTLQCSPVMKQLQQRKHRENIGLKVVFSILPATAEKHKTLN